MTLTPILASLILLVCSDTLVSGHASHRAHAHQASTFDWKRYAKATGLSKSKTAAPSAGAAETTPGAGAFDFSKYTLVNGAAAGGAFDFSKFPPGGGAGAAGGGGFDMSKFIPAPEPGAPGGFDWSKFSAGKGSAGTTGGFDWQHMIPSGSPTGKGHGKGAHKHGKELTTMLLPTDVSMSADVEKATPSDASTSASQPPFDYSKYIPAGGAGGAGFDWSKFMPSASPTEKPHGHKAPAKETNAPAGAAFDYSKYMAGGAAGAPGAPGAAGGFDWQHFMPGSAPADAGDAAFSQWLTWMGTQSRKSWQQWCAFMCQQNDAQGVKKDHSFHHYMVSHGVTSWQKFAKFLEAKPISTFAAYDKWTSQHAALATSYDWEGFVKASAASAAPKQPELQCSFVKCPPGQVCETGMCKPAP